MTKSLPAEVTHSPSASSSVPISRRLSTEQESSAETINIAPQTPSIAHPPAIEVAPRIPSAIASSNPPIGETRHNSATSSTQREMASLFSTEPTHSSSEAESHLFQEAASTSDNINKLKVILSCCLDLHHSRISLIANDPVALHQLKSPMSELVKDHVALLLPVEVAQRLKILYKHFTPAFNTFRKNQEQILSLARLDDHSLESSNETREVEQLVDQKRQSLQSISNELTSLDAEEASLEEHRLAIEKRLEEVRNLRTTKLF